MKKISKVIEAIEGKSWVNVVEYPDETLCLEGIKLKPLDPSNTSELGTYIVSLTRFSEAAIEQLIPLMQAWPDQKREGK